MDASTEQDRSLEPKDLTGGDYGFMALIVVVLIAVTILGVMSFREANKTEGTKRNGEQWAAWFTKASETRFAPGYAIAACAGGAKRVSLALVNQAAHCSPLRLLPSVLSASRCAITPSAVTTTNTSKMKAIKP